MNYKNMKTSELLKEAKAIAAILKDRLSADDFEDEGKRIFD